MCNEPCGTPGAGQVSHTFLIHLYIDEVLSKQQLTEGTHAWQPSPRPGYHKHQHTLPTGKATGITLACTPPREASMLPASRRKAVVVLARDFTAPAAARSLGCRQKQKTGAQEPQEI